MVQALNNALITHYIHTLANTALEWCPIMHHVLEFAYPEIRDGRYIACDVHAHLVSKAGSLISAKSPSPVFKWSGI